jgi:hypothetical protein
LSFIPPFAQLISKFPLAISDRLQVFFVRLICTYLRQQRSCFEGN